MLVRVLLSVPDNLRTRITDLLRCSDVVIVAALKSRDYLNDLKEQSIDLVVTVRDFLPDDPQEFFSHLEALADPPEVLVISSEEDAEDRARLLATGCMAVIYECLDDDLIRGTIMTLLSRFQRPKRTAQRSLLVVRSLKDITSKSAGMLSLLSLARRCVNVETTLLFLGETGVGKELLARAVHLDGSRRDGPFVAVNCGGISETLLDSELFGHEKGAFTGAIRDRRGAFELAHRGTLFLDEIGDMPLQLQVKLLRILQEKKFYRLGGERQLSVDVRIMAATNQDLERATQEHRFRRDLYYRLAVMTMRVPSLVERPEDIPALVHRFLSHFRQQMRHDVKRVSNHAMEALMKYHWPGNVRELINVVERAVLLAAGNEILPEDLPGEIMNATNRKTCLPQLEESTECELQFGSELPLHAWKQARKEAIARFEQDYLQQLLQSTGGRIGEAARMSGLNPRSLYEQMNKYGLEKKNFRN